MALLLTGRPGVGKTTIIRAVGRALGHLPLVGFFTEEIRVGRERRGFRLVTFGGEEAVIAHVEFPPPRVSKYGVDVGSIERFARDLRDTGDPSAGIYLIDEIGRMECLSGTFVRVMRHLVDGGRPLVATVGERGGGFIDEVKHLPTVELWTVTPATRDGLPDRIIVWLGLAGESRPL
jgi:nucleoside-triphosphatase